MFRNLIQSCKKVFIFYLVIIVLVSIAWQFYFSRMHSIGEALSRFIPTFDYFTVKDINPLSKRRYYLNECRVYHQLVSLYYRFQEPEAQMIVGYCSYYDNNIENAIKAYKRVQHLNPSYFWPYYNLGVIYFKQQNWQKAIEYLKEALNQDLVHNEMMYRHSKVLTDIRLSDKKGELRIDGFLKLRYHQAIEYVLYAFYKQENYKDLLNVSLQAIQNSTGDIYILQRYAAIACVHLGLWDKAKLFLENVLTRYPNDADALLYLSYVYQFQHDYVLAEQLRVMSERERIAHGSLMEGSINPEVVIF